MRDSYITKEPVSPMKIQTSQFYEEWEGHPISDLQTLCSTLRSVRPKKPLIYLAGDSSLDNKAWVSPGDTSVAAPELYTHVFDTVSSPPVKADVAFWMNHLLGDKASCMCVNSAVEASLLRDRDNKLLPHDEFIRDNIGPNDILIVSVGANDIALSPNTKTMLHMADLAWTTPRSRIEQGTASSLPYFRHMFKDKVQSYIERMCEKQKPRAVIVCTIYFPLEAGAGQSGWADAQLKALGYGSRPEQLQAAIREIHNSATKAIQIDGTQVIACPLFEVLDGKRKEEYIARVEPSSEGGRKMAEKFVEMLKGTVDGL